MKKVLFLLFFSLLQYSSIAQNTTTKHQFSINYLGETFTHPGFSVLYSYSIYQKEKSTTNSKEKHKLYLIQYQSTNRIAFYIHPKNHNSLLATSGIRLQRTQSTSWRFGVGVQAGYQLKFINDDTYQINNGAIERTKWNTQSLFVIGLATNIGKDFSIKKSNQHFGWHISNTILWSSPFRSTRQLLPLFELGLSYYLHTPQP